MTPGRKRGDAADSQCTLGLIAAPGAPAYELNRREACLWTRPGARSLARRRARESEVDCKRSACTQGCVCERGVHRLEHYRSRHDVAVEFIYDRTVVEQALATRPALRGRV